MQQSTWMLLARELCLMQVAASAANYSFPLHPPKAALPITSASFSPAPFITQLDPTRCQQKRSWGTAERSLENLTLSTTIHKYTT
jgi:hypothetical protein